VLYTIAVGWLNYHHLLYFWTVAREGTITAASEKLRLAQPTISTQIRVLEKTLGHKLFEHQGRNLVLTETGRMVYSYANEIFALGQELTDTLEGRPVAGRTRLRVGIADVVSKQVAHRILRAALEGPEPAKLVCFEGKPASLLTKLAVHELDLVLSDSPVPPEVKLKGFNHLLGESDVSIVATPELAARYRRLFPKSLDGAPFLLPTENTSLRRSLDLWFSSRGINPVAVGEFEDTALLLVFGQAGAGLFAVPAVIEDGLRQLHDLRVVGRVESVRAQYFAISLERKLKHPGVVAIVEAAHSSLAG
jgi:LysR family transcriptional activator of nhaA